MVTNILNINSEKSTILEVPVSYKEPQAIDLEKIHNEIYKKAQDAYYTNNPFTIYPEVKGIDFDIESAKSIIEEEKEEIARRKQPVKIDEKQMAQKLEQAQIMPKEKKKGIYKRTFENILVAVIVILYFLMMILGYINIPEEAYIKDLKVFSLATIAITIVLFEIAYNKDSGKIAIHGIETLLLSILTLVSMYIYILHRTKFLFVIMGGVVLATLYYLVRSIAVTIKEKRKWKDNISDVKDIVT